MECYAAIKIQIWTARLHRVQEHRVMNNKAGIPVLKGDAKDDEMGLLR